MRENIDCYRTFQKTFHRTGLRCRISRRIFDSPKSGYQGGQIVFCVDYNRSVPTGLVYLTVRVNLADQNSPELFTLIDPVGATLRKHGLLAVLGVGRYL